MSEPEKKYNSKAEREYLDAAKNGDADAQFKLGSRYFYGIGVKEDKQKAAE